jgi:hypothetical protein
MRVFRTAVIAALLIAPACAHAEDMHVNLIPELKSLTPEEREAEAARDKAYKESLKKIPDTKASSDPWGTVRSTDTPKTSKTSVAKPRTKTGSTAN